MQSQKRICIYQKVKKVFTERMSNPFDINRIGRADYDYPDANLLFLRIMNIEI